MSSKEAYLETAPVVVAPDGLTVRPLLETDRGSLAEFRLAAGLIGRTVRHRTIEEIWHVTEGAGAVWREGLSGGAPLNLAPGSAFVVPPGVAFQVRAGESDLVVIATTMPPWPGEDEVEVLEGVGPWMPTL